MLAKLSQPLNYGKVERALATLHGIAPEGVPALRSRLAVLVKADLFGAEHRPGKGRWLNYQSDQLDRTLLAFQLAELGYPRGLILRLIERRWQDKLRRIFAAAERSLARGSGDGDDVILLLLGGAAISGEEPVIEHVTLDKLAPRLTTALGGERSQPRVLLVNLTVQLRRFHAALVDDHPLLEFEVEAMTEPKSVPAPEQPSRRRTKVPA